MKKLKSLNEFKQLSSNTVLLNSDLVTISAGLARLSNDMCVTLNDTCVNGREDMYHHTEVDGVVTVDSTTWKD